MDISSLDVFPRPQRIKHRIIELAFRYGLTHAEIWATWYRLCRYGAASWSPDNVLKVDRADQGSADDIAELLMLVEQMALKRSMRFADKNTKHLLIRSSRAFSAYLTSQGNVCSSLSREFHTQHKLIHQAAISSCRSITLIAAHSLLMDEMARFHLSGQPLDLDPVSIRSDHMELVFNLLTDNQHGVMSWSERHLA